MKHCAILALALLLSSAACSSPTQPPKGPTLPMAGSASFTTQPTRIPPTITAVRPPTAAPSPTARSVEIPKPPAPLVVAAGSPEAKAAALAEAVGPKSKDPLAGWLAVYDALGIPVLSANRTPVGTTGDDPIGPAFWRVWYMSGMARPGSGFPLTDFVKVFNVGGVSTFDSAQAAARLLQDLRAASASRDPHVQLFGRFVAEMVRRGPGHVDLADASVTADKVMISGDVAELISWAVIRNLVFAMAPKTTSSLGAPLRASPDARAGDVALTIMQRQPVRPAGRLVPPVIPRLEQGGCTSLTSEDVTYWINWALSKIVGGGVQLPGMTEATKGLVEYVQDKGGVSTSIIEKTKAMTGIANSVASVLSLAMQIYALTVDTYMDPSPLVRTRTTTDGDKATLYIALRYDPGRLPDGNQKAACVASFLLNAFGISFSLPGAQRLPGVELLVSEGKGFGELVLWGDFRQRRQDTNQNGEAEVLILGKAQKRTLPDSASPAMKEFSVHISAQPEAMTANSIANMFFDSLSFWAAPSANGLVSAGVDLAKAFHYDLGEFVLPLKDWATGYKVHGTYWGAYNLTGTICEGLDKPFVLQADANLRGPHMIGQFTLTPASTSGGNWSFSGAMEGWPASASGTFGMEGVADGVPVVSMGGGSWTVTAPFVGAKPLGPGGEHLGTIESIELEPITEECATP